MLLVNIYPDIMANPEDTSNGVGGLLHYFYILDEWSILPSLIFMGVGAMTDFGPLIANPISFLMGAAAQLGIYRSIFRGNLHWIQWIRQQQPSPSSVELTARLPFSWQESWDRPALMGPIAVAAYSYMSLVPIIQPPIMKAADYRRRAEDQDGAASSGIQTGEDPVPHRRLPSLCV